MLNSSPRQSGYSKSYARTEAARLRLASVVAEMRRRRGGLMDFIPRVARGAAHERRGRAVHDDPEVVVLEPGVALREEVDELLHAHGIRGRQVAQPQVVVW